MSKSNNFKNQCREHQSEFRSKVLWIGYDRYINVLYEDDGKRGLNFFDGFGIFEAVKARYPYFRKPLYCNLLRSEHVPFNFFIPLILHKEFGSRVFNDILKGIIEEVIKIEIEYPRDTPTVYLQDRTSFDTYVEYKHMDGTIGIIGIEVKYTERSYPYSGITEKTKMEDPDSIYYRRSRESGVFLNTIDLKHNDYRQLWRNHLLGESILIIDKRKYSHFHSLTFYPSGNIHFQEVIPKYKEHLKPEYKDRVQGVTYEQFFDICKKYSPNEEYGEWLEWLFSRYLL